MRRVCRGIVCHGENARFLARHIRDGKYAELPGSDHAPWGDGDDIVAEIGGFLTGGREPVTPDRVLAAVLVTGIVASAEHATRLGEGSWPDLVPERHRLIRHELARFRGREIDSAGDGFLAAVDGPAGRCASPRRSFTPHSRRESRYAPAFTPARGRS